MKYWSFLRLKRIKYRLQDKDAKMLEMLENEKFSKAKKKKTTNPKGILMKPDTVL